MIFNDFQCSRSEGKLWRATKAFESLGVGALQCNRVFLVHDLINQVGVQPHVVPFIVLGICGLRTQVASELIPPLETRDQPAAAQTKRPSLAAKVEKE